MAGHPKRLFLFDGSALVYRSHFAFIKDPLRNSRGLNTSAAFGFTRDLLKILDDEEPDRVAVVFDVSKRTFRHAKYEAYKATRARMPDELVDSLPYVEKLVDALGVPRLGLEGFEADDLVATLAVKGSAAGYDVMIVTGDKDLCQLVDGRIRLWNPWRQGPGPRAPKAEVMDREGVIARHGVPPEGFRDYLALVGDASDNVPGVPGVGPKRALELLTAFGSLDQLLARKEEVRWPSVRQSLIDHEKDALLSRELVTLDRAVPLPVEPDALVRKEPDRAALARLFAELEFRELLKRFSTDTKDDPHVHHRVAPGELPALVRRLREAPEVVLDLETTSLDPNQADVVGMAFSVKEGEAWYLGAEERAGAQAARPVAAPPGQLDLFAPQPATLELFPLELDFSRHLAALKPVLEDPAVKKGGQNVKYDVMVLARHGITVRGIAFDTLLESYLLDPSQKTHNLDDLAMRVLGYRKIQTSDVIGKGGKKRTMRDAPDRDIFPYCSEDADITMRLHREFTARLEAEPGLQRLYHEVELPLMSILMRMERTGVKIDRDALAALGKDMRARLRGFEQEIHDLAGPGFNMSSPKQVGALLFDKLELHKLAGLRPKRTATGAISTDAEVLEELAPHHPLPRKILEHRALEKLIGTYVDALLSLVDETGRVHTSFNQAVTATGRLSSSDPNLQNIPIRTAEGRTIRSVFVAGEPGWSLLSADYSQVELRILAHLSGDETLLDAFRRDLDVHRATAARIFDVPIEQVTSELRGRAKAINFGIVYGMGAQRLARDTGISVDEARTFIEGYFAKYPKIQGYLKSQVEHARQHGYVETVLGRRRPLSDIRSGQRQMRANAERMAVNTPIQGSAADIIKVAMVRIDRRLAAEKLRARMLLQVHDELLFEAPQDELDRLEALVREEMVQAYPMTVPLKVDIGRGRTWLDSH